MVVLMAAVFAATGWVLVREERVQLTRELTRRVLAETQSLSVAVSAPLLRHDPELGLHPLILRSLEEMPDLNDVVVLDDEGVVQGHRALQEIGRAFPSRATGHAVGDAWTSIEGPDLVIWRPIRQHDRVIGTLVVNASRAGIETAVQKSVRRLVLNAGGGMALAVLVVLVVVTRGLRPLDHLERGVSQIGAGDLSTRLPAVGSNELGLLASQINDMAESLESAQRELIQKEKLDHELQIARKLQSGLLPGSLQAPAGYELAAAYTAARTVGGDYYDVVPLADGNTVLIVADVAGKGVPGLVVMAMTRVILRGLSVPGRTPTEALILADHMLRGAISKGMFVTCLYAVLEPDRGIFHYASAGHCAPMKLGECAELLEAGGKPLGLFGSEVFRKSIRSHTAVLAENETILLYTDGLYEAMNGDGEQLGLERVERVALREHRKPGALLPSLEKVISDWSPGDSLQDDLTLLALRRQPVADSTKCELVQELLA
jgi:sigma-B regulation protein RsbU (phosphoserine phosphatase)